MKERERERETGSEGEAERERQRECEREERLRDELEGGRMKAAGSLNPSLRFLVKRYSAFVVVINTSAGRIAAAISTTLYFGCQKEHASVALTITLPPSPKKIYKFSVYSKMCFLL